MWRGEIYRLWGVRHDDAQFGERAVRHHPDLPLCQTARFRRSLGGQAIQVGADHD
jgi:hypothetical protein